MRRGVVIALIGVLSGGAVAQPSGSVETNELSGTLGPYRVGMNLTIRDDRAFVAGHYFYSSSLKDIPMTGGMEGERLTLREPGGGVFDLHLVTSDKTAKPPLTFDTSTGLEGSWTQGTRTLPVKLQTAWSRRLDQPKRLYASVDARSDAAVEAVVRRFQRGVVTGDHELTASAVAFPLRVNFHRNRTLHIKSKAELVRRWAQVFTPAYVARLRRDVPHEMFSNLDGVSLGPGDAWFNGRGAVVLNVDTD